VINHMVKEDNEQARKESERQFHTDEVSRMRRQVTSYQRPGFPADPQQRERETALWTKIIDIFKERDITFYDCFQHLYDPLDSRKSMVSIAEFKAAVNKLNLPLTVQDQRVLRRMADPQQIGKVDLQAFCSLFETEELRMKRLNDVLEKVATAFYVKNFNLRRAFALFDEDNDGYISRREFRNGWLTLNLGLTFDEIDDLMKLVDKNNDGAVSYDEFISHMDVHIKQKEKTSQEHAEEVLFLKLKDFLDFQQSGGPKSKLNEVFKEFEIYGTDTVLAQDLPKVFKRIGLSKPEPYMPILLKAGGASEDDDKIEIKSFCSKLLAHIKARAGKNIKESYKILNRLYQLLQTRKLSIFELFLVLDVNKSATLSKIELKTGIQNLGLPIQSKEFETLWKALKQSERVQAEQD